MGNTVDRVLSLNDYIYKCLKECLSVDKTKTFVCIIYTVLEIFSLVVCE